MDNEKKVSLAVVILHCICAVVWSINVFLGLAYENTNSINFVVHVICAILWGICAVVEILRYLKWKKNNK